MHAVTPLEPLEPRQLFSVSFTQLAEPLDQGNLWQYRLTVDDGSNRVVSTVTQKVDGTKTLGGVETSRVKVSRRTVQSGVTTISKGNSFERDAAEGRLVERSNSERFVNGNPQGTSVTTFNPHDERVPATLEAGRVVESRHRRVVSTTSSLPGGQTVRVVTNVRLLTKLTSETRQTVTVPAGTFSAYVVKQTRVETSGGERAVEKSTYWAVPGVGLVKSRGETVGEPGFAAFKLRTTNTTPAAPPPLSDSFTFGGGDDEDDDGAPGGMGSGDYVR